MTGRTTCDCGSPTIRRICSRLREHPTRTRAIPNRRCGCRPTRRFTANTPWLSSQCFAAMICPSTRRRPSSCAMPRPPARPVESSDAPAESDVSKRCGRNRCLRRRRTDELLVVRVESGGGDELDQDRHRRARPVRSREGSSARTHRPVRSASRSIRRIPHRAQRFPTRSLSSTSHRKVMRRRSHCSRSTFPISGSRRDAIERRDRPRRRKRETHIRSRVRQLWWERLRTDRRTRSSSSNSPAPKCRCRFRDPVGTGCRRRDR